ncbi:MAG TPA: tetratricopeptide repeat protein [Planctomycetes bacterium]|nr:tetratricopeptide repeat protein [Planctomycetota bacterium]
MVPFLPLPMAMDPLLAGRPLIATIEPTKKLEKRLRVLLEAGFPRSALVLVDKALKKERRSLRLHYLRARILESLGRLDEARKVLQIVAKVDTEQDEDGKDLPGPWAKAAKSALDYLSWRSGVKSKTFKIPDLKDLKW